MDISAFYKSVLEQDNAPIVLCDPDHTIVYMNRAAAARYQTRGGYDLVGKSLMDCHMPQTREIIEKILAWFAESPDHNRVYESRNDKENKDVYTVALRDDDGNLIGYYEKHEYRDRETGKLLEF